MGSRWKILFSLLFLSQFLFFPWQVCATSNIERVIIISIDSMNNDFIFNEYDNPDYRITPNIGFLIENGASFSKAEAVMPTKTQVNHVTLVSGAFAEKIGIVGNYVFDKEKKDGLFLRRYDFPWKKPELIKADTIFKSLERKDPEYTSAVVGGKNYVGCPIWADIQVAPASTSEWAKQLGIKKFPEIQLWDSPDEWVMDNSLLLLEEVDPDLMLINLAFLDPVQHAMGHSSMESWATLSWADYQVGRLIKYLIEAGKLNRTLIVLTADHGQTNTWERIPLSKILRENDLKANVIADGSFASIFLDDLRDLERAVEFLEGQSYIDGLWYNENFDEVHIDTPYTGDIAVSLAPPYEAFSRIRPPFMGIHGGLQQRFIPLIFFGPNVESGLFLEKASLVDVVPTICELTGFPLPDDSQGMVLPIINRDKTVSPNISYSLIDYPVYKLSYIALIFLVLSILLLLPALLSLRNLQGLEPAVSTEPWSSIVPLLLFTSSTLFAIASSFYSYIVNLYNVPGIQPDSFLVAMDFGILGSFLVSIMLCLIILWYLPLLLRMVIRRIRGRRFRLYFSPFSMVSLIVSQISFTVINLVTDIPYNNAFEIFVVFFFGGLGLSCVNRIRSFSRSEAYNRRDIVFMVVSGIIIGVIWFLLMVFLLFPNYFYEYGIAVF